MARKFDARPDRLDLRDRPYCPRLVNLPEQYPSREIINDFLTLYRELIQNQGDQGACTGFGLAAVINYLLCYEAIRRRLKTDPAWKPGQPLPSSLLQLQFTTVSPQMLFTLAKFYDEWPDEDNNSSSCRGAIKGWHRHGVCRDKTWPHPLSYEQHRGRKYKKDMFIAPDPGWEQEAARIPLGAYYRINKSSISDMQAAIAEVGAIFTSAHVNQAWELDALEDIPDSEQLYGLHLKRIPFRSEQCGGHAFAIIGYCADGFIIQNSWGTSWGTNGFAVLTYEGWAFHGKDAWVAVMGAPTKADGDFLVSSGKEGLTGWLCTQAKTTGAGTGKGIFGHLVVVGYTGRACNNFIDQQDGTQALKNVVFKAIEDALLTPGKSGPYRHIAVIADSGHTDPQENRSAYKHLIERLQDNTIYPLILTWNNAIGDKIKDAMARQLSLEQPAAADLQKQPAYAWDAESKDRFLELICRTESIKSFWDECKLAADRSGKRYGAISLLATYLSSQAARLQKNNIRLHLAGFSAGAMLTGHLLHRLSEETSVDTLSLIAPACTVDFACTYFLPAILQGKVPAAMVQILLQDYRLELEDTFGKYHKSFLYLASRGLEEQHKTPLLGMHLSWITSRDRRELIVQPGMDEASSMMPWPKGAPRKPLHRWLEAMSSLNIRPVCTLHPDSSTERNRLLANHCIPVEHQESDKLIIHDSLVSNTHLIEMLIGRIQGAHASH